MCRTVGVVVRKVGLSLGAELIKDWREEGSELCLVDLLLGVSAVLLRLIVIRVQV